MNAVRASVMQDAGPQNGTGMEPSLQGLPPEHPLLQRAQKKLAQQLQEKALVLKENLREKEYSLKVRPDTACVIPEAWNLCKATLGV